MNYGGGFYPKSGRNWLNFTGLENFIKLKGIQYLPTQLVASSKNCLIDPSPQLAQNFFFHCLFVC